jgi:hypothetical protein
MNNCSKEEPGSFPRVNNHINAKIGWDHLKIFSVVKSHRARRAHIYRKAF